MYAASRRRLFQALTILLLGVFEAGAGDDAAIRKAGGTLRDTGGGVAVEFHLTARGLGDDALECIAGRNDLVSLNLRDTKVTDEGMLHLVALGGLKRLHLERTAVGDRGMESVSRLENLEYLNLYATKLTDSGLKPLEKLKNLKQLFVWETRVTDEGCRRLQLTLPDLKIVRGVDLDRISAEAARKAKEPAEPLVELEWHPAGSEEPPVSQTGTFTTVYFENRRPRPVKLYWVQYGKGGLRFYADIGAGKTLKRNTFSEATWVITDESDIQLGYFRSVLKPSRAVIPAK